MRINVNFDCGLRINAGIKDIYVNTSNLMVQNNVSYVNLYDLLFMKLINGELTGVDDQANNVAVGFYKVLVFTDDGNNVYELNTSTGKVDKYEDETNYIYEIGFSTSANSINNNTGTFYLVEVKLMFKGSQVVYDNTNNTYDLTIPASDMFITKIPLGNSVFAENIPTFNQSPQYTKGIKLDFNGTDNINFISKLIFKIGKSTY